MDWTLPLRSTVTISQFHQLEVLSSLPQQVTIVFVSELSKGANIIIQFIQKEHEPRTTGMTRTLRALLDKIGHQIVRFSLISKTND